MDELVAVGVLAGALVLSEARRWAECRAWAAERRELVSRVQAGTLASYESLRERPHEGLAAGVRRRSPAPEPVEESVPIKIGVLGDEAIGGGESTFSRLMREAG